MTNFILSDCYTVTVVTPLTFLPCYVRVLVVPVEYRQLSLGIVLVIVD